MPRHWPKYELRHTECIPVVIRSVQNTHPALHTPMPCISRGSDTPPPTPSEMFWKVQACWCEFLTCYSSSWKPKINKKRRREICAAPAGSDRVIRQRPIKRKKSVYVWGGGVWRFKKICKAKTAHYPLSSCLSTHTKQGDFHIYASWQIITEMMNPSAQGQRGPIRALSSPRGMVLHSRRAVLVLIWSAWMGTLN